MLLLIAMKYLNLALIGLLTSCTVLESWEGSPAKKLLTGINEGQVNVRASYGMGIDFSASINNAITSADSANVSGVGVEYFPVTAEDCLGSKKYLIKMLKYLD